MIISHKHKACYWKVARTGSNTAELCLRMRCDLGSDAVITDCHFFPSSHNVPDWVDWPAHFRPTDAIREGLLTEDQYEEYDHYAMIRSPYTRFKSAFMLRFQDRDCPDPITWLENRKKTPVEPMDWLLVPQSEYFHKGRVNVLQFENYEDSLQTIVEGFGGSITDIPKLQHRKSDAPTGANKAWSEADPFELDEAIQRCYAADISHHISLWSTQ